MRVTGAIFVDLDAAGDSVFGGVSPLDTIASLLQLKLLTVGHDIAKIRSGRYIRNKAEQDDETIWVCRMSVSLVIYPKIES